MKNTRKYSFISGLNTTKLEKVVPEVGIEPTRGCPRRILNPVRLPISPLRHNSVDIHKYGFELGNKIPHDHLYWQKNPSIMLFPLSNGLRGRILIEKFPYFTSL